MTPSELLALVARRPLLLDGGLGSVYISMGLEEGRAPEHWLVDHPDRVIEAHRRYAIAGSDIIHTTTFGATPPKLTAAGVRLPCADVNSIAVDLARRAALSTTLVAGDIGPTGRFLPPTGDATEDELQEAFAVQVSALAKAGVDLLSIETMYDVREARAALRAARESGLAVLCSMTFEPKRRGAFTFMGDPLQPSLASLRDEGATAVGLNCSVTSSPMVAMVSDAVAALSGTPLVAQPNAGQPIRTEHGVRYDADVLAFSADLMRMVALGARIVGGCCGTDEHFVRAARQALDAGISP